MIMPAGRPSTSTTAAPAFSSASTALLTCSPEPTMGSGADMCSPTGAPGLCLAGDQRVEQIDSITR